MDEYEYLDHFFYSPTLSDLDLKQRSSDLCGESGQQNGLFLSSVGINEDVNNNSHTSMINSNNSNGSTESLAAQDASSVVLGSESDFGISAGFHSGEAQVQEDDQNNFFSGVTNLADCQYDHMANIPANGDISSSSLPFPEVGLGHMQCNNALEPSNFPSFQADFQTLSPIPHLSPLPPPFEGVSSLSPDMVGQDSVVGFGLQGGEYADNDFYAMESHSSDLSASLSSKGTYGLPNYPSSSFVSGPQMTRTMAGLKSLSQTASTAPPGESNGTGKPRVRARRGQATDPHSIAERLRREKIADRMKSLQELLPNPNKTDKASMLDEIIEYVKFLQLQVKVLSTSRLGAADAVEAGNGMLLSPSSGQVADVAFPSDEIAFERELVKLMESSVAKAMQHLQTKGLCLVPVGLASSVPTRKEKESSSSSSPSSLSASLVDDRKRNGIHHISSNGNTESNTVVSNKCVVAAEPAEEGHNISPTSKELEPKI